MVQAPSGFWCMVHALQPKWLIIPPYNSPVSTVNSNCASTRSHVGQAPAGAEMLSLKALGFLFVRGIIYPFPFLCCPTSLLLLFFRVVVHNRQQPTHRPDSLPSSSPSHSAVRYGTTRPEPGGNGGGTICCRPDPMYRERAVRVLQAVWVRPCFGLVIDF